MDMGAYDYNVYTCDQAVKDVYSKLPVMGGYFIIGQFICGANYHFIVEKTSQNFGSMHLITYAGIGIISYKDNEGTLFKDQPQCDRVAI